MSQPSFFFKTIGEATGRNGYAKSPEEAWVALEFENETKKPFNNPPIPGYKFHPENSLRHHGFEYVFNAPVPIKDVKGYADNYFHYIKLAAGDKNPLTCSSRTSTHVHWDITRLTYIQALNWSICYWLVEDLLSEFCGTDRQGNHFCLRMKDAAMTQSSLTNSIKKRTPWNAGSFSEEYRYGSINLNAWKKFGSMEFRMLQGVDNSEKLMDWISALENSRQFALGFENPWDIYKFFIDKTTAEDFAKKVFGDRWSAIYQTLPQVYDVGINVRSAFMSLTPLFLSGGDWKFTEELKKEAEQKKTTGESGVLFYSDGEGAVPNSLSLSSISIGWGGNEPIFSHTPMYTESHMPSYMVEDFIPELDINEILLDPNSALFGDL